MDGCLSLTLERALDTHSLSDLSGHLNGSRREAQAGGMTLGAMRWSRIASWSCQHQGVLSKARGFFFCDFPTSKYSNKFKIVINFCNTSPEYVHRFPLACGLVGTCGMWVWSQTAWFSVWFSIPSLCALQQVT